MLRPIGDLGVDIGVAGRGVDEPGIVEVGGPELASMVDNSTRSAQGSQILADLRGDNLDVGTGCHEIGGPTGSHRPAADHDHSTTRQPQGQWVGVGRRHTCIPHSVLAVPLHRPARELSPGATGLVHGEQPMDS